MAILGRLIGKAIKKGASKKVRTSAQKAALKKAVKASALARAKKGGAKAVSRRVAKKTARKAAIAKVDKLGLKRVAKGFKAGGITRVSTENFEGAAGKALKKSTYAARLASSRARYHTQTSLGSKVKQKAIGVVSVSGIWRRRYSDLTTGENVRRNLSRAAKATAVLKTAEAAYRVSHGGKAIGSIDPVQSAIDMPRMNDSIRKNGVFHEKKLLKKYGG